jgi:glutamate formiminotransferase/formiminotetrahydrofolate cyclodeaminase
LIKKAQELIDMRGHKGEHPRFGATDVCPLVPISGISMEETAVPYAKARANASAKNCPSLSTCYEAAASEEKRRNLANNRAASTKAFPRNSTDPAWKPDFGPAAFTDGVARSGAIAIGARNFLVAYNVNLNTTSTRRANAIAFDIREAGRKVKQADGSEVQVPRQAEGGEGHRLVHRRVRHRTTLLEPHGHHPHPHARGLRRGVQERRATWHPCDRQ